MRSKLTLGILAILVSAPLVNAAVPALVVLADTFDVDTVEAGVWDAYGSSATAGSYAVEEGRLELKARTGVFGVQRPVTLAPTGAVLEARVTGELFYKFALQLLASDGTTAHLEFNAWGVCLCRHTAAGYVVDYFAPAPVAGQEYVLRVTLANGGALVGEVLDADGTLRARRYAADASLAPEAVAAVRLQTWTEGWAVQPTRYLVEEVALLPGPAPLPG